MNVHNSRILDVDDHSQRISNGYQGVEATELNVQKELPLNVQ